MQVIIVGGGEVGTEISKQLSIDHDVVIIEQKKEKGRQIASILDVKMVEGNGASSRILEEVGIRKTGLLIAVTETDEVNIISCMLAKKYGVPRTVARIRNPEYASGESIFTNEQLGIDYIINPEALTAEEIKKSIDFPDIDEIEYYADGEIKLMALTAKKGDLLINIPLKDLNLPKGCIICALLRKNSKPIIPSGDDMIRVGNQVYIMGLKDSFNIYSIFNRIKVKNKNIVIAGGGRVGLLLAEMLEKDNRSGVWIKIIEKDSDRCEEIAGKLNKTIVLNADATDAAFLKSEEIEKSDAFVGVAGDDETNLLSTLLAKKMGAKRTISEVVRSDFNIILNNINLDKVVSPRVLTASRIMKLLLKGNVVNYTILKEEEAEILEILLSENSVLSGKKLKDAGLPKGMLVGAITRKGSTLIPQGEDLLQAGDRIVLFTMHSLIPSVEEIFATEKALRKKLKMV